MENARRSHAGVACPKKIAVPAGRGRQVIETIHQGLKADAPPSRAACSVDGSNCRAEGSGAPYQTDKADDRREPVVWLSHRRTSARHEQNTVQRIFQLKGWQMRKRATGFRPRIEARISGAARPNERWATDMCRAWTGRDGWAVLALVADCCSRELLGWHLSRSGKAKAAESALEHALIA